MEHGQGGCGHCGRPFAVADRFCPQCGRPILPEDRERAAGWETCVIRLRRVSAPLVGAWRWRFVAETRRPGPPAIVARHCPHLLDAPAAGGQPVVWREHDPSGRGAPAEHDRVTFAPWRIRAIWLGGTLRRALGTPHWARLDRAGVAALLGPPPTSVGEW